MSSAFLSFWDHLEELRNTLIRVSLCLVLGFFISFFFHEKLLHFILTSPEKHDIETIVYEKRIVTSKTDFVFSLPKGARVISPVELAHLDKIALKAGQAIELEVPKKETYFFHPMEGFLLALKVSFCFGMVLSSPLWLYFLSRFFFPALSDKQKNLFLPFVFLSILFISIGMFFAYQITLPFIFNFFKNFNDHLGQNLWGALSIANFSLSLLLSHGMIFELYVILLFLTHFEILTYTLLKRGRRYVIVLSLILGAILTPPDIFSQLLVAVPLMILYETALLYSFLKFLRFKTIKN